MHIINNNSRVRYSAPLVELIDITPESCIAASLPANNWNDGSIPNIPGNYNNWPTL